MYLQFGKFVLIALSTAPTLHLPTRPIPRLEPLAALLQRELFHTHKEARVEAQIVLFVFQARRMHLTRHDVDMHVVHARMRMHACFDFGQPVPAWREEGVALLWWWWIRRAHQVFQRFLVGLVRSAVASVFASEFAGCELLETRHAFLHFGQEGRVGGEQM